MYLPLYLHHASEGKLNLIFLNIQNLRKMNKNKFIPNEMLATAKMNQVRGGGLLTDMRTAYTDAKGTPATSSTSIARPSSVRGDELVAKVISGVSALGAKVGATAQDVYVATNVALAALPYVR